VDSKGNVIENAGGYVPDTDRFIGIMDRVDKKFKALKEK
jgi:hypothetical protein